jgi:YspA, cpYpsA-related SLOG family
MRVLITGSRTWTNASKISMQLALITAGIPPALVVVVHGNAAGADRLADYEARRQGMGVERFPADWKLYGKRAGFVRNAQMVSTKPTVCLAFIRNGSLGASMCADLAEKAGIPTHRFTEDDS